MTYLVLKNDTSSPAADAASYRPATLQSFLPTRSRDKEKVVLIQPGVYGYPYPPRTGDTGRRRIRWYCG